MKIQITKPKKVSISDVANLDAIGIFIDDYSPGHGRITLTCSDFAWTRLWGAMGNSTMTEFFCNASNEYLVGKLSRYDHDDLELLDRVITTARVGLEAMKAMEIAAAPLPEVAPIIPQSATRVTTIEADEI